MFVGLICGIGRSHSLQPSPHCVKWYIKYIDITHVKWSGVFVSVPTVSYFQQVPDVDTDIGNMTENPLNVDHTPYQPRPCTQSTYGRNNPNTAVALRESVCNEDPSQMVCSVASQESMSEQASVGEDLSSMKSALTHEPTGNEREEQSVSHSCETVNGTCGSDGVSSVNAIPVKVQHAALHLMPPLSTSVATQTEVEDDPAQNDATEAATLSTSAHCSTGLEQTPQNRAASVNKSVQTENTGTFVCESNCKEKGVQVSTPTDTAEMMSGPEYGPCTTEHSTNPCSCGNQLVSTAERASSSNESVTLREELKNTQNTVIWQSLMLRVYAMH